MNGSQVSSQITEAYQSGAEWSITVSLGALSLMFLAYLIGFAIRSFFR